MSKVYDAVDLFWSTDGDYEIGDGGDVQDTSYDFLRSLRQEIETRVKSSIGDWRLHSGIAAGLDRFVGMQNTREIGQEIKAAVINALIYGGLVDLGDLEIKVAPISTTIIAVRVVVRHLSTQRNANSLPVTKTFIYDYADNNVFPVDTGFSEF